MTVCPGPKVASYRVVPGKLDPAALVCQLRGERRPGRGEACHFLDYLCFLFESRPVRVYAQTIGPARGPVAISG